MAIYHLEAKVVSRGTGRSAVAASAYLSCSKILNVKLGKSTIKVQHRSLCVSFCKVMLW